MLGTRENRIGRSFLGCFGEPFGRCVCRCTLKTGYLIIAWWNVLSALVIVIGFIVQITQMILNDDPSEFVNFALVRNSVGLVVGISAACGIGGLYRRNLPLIYQYYLVRLVLGPIGNVLFTVDVILNYSSGNVGIIVGAVLLGVAQVVVSFFLTKVVWSVYVRMQYGQAALVYDGIALQSNIGLQDSSPDSRSNIKLPD